MRGEMDTVVGHMTDVDWINWCIDHKLVHEIHTSERRSFRSCRRRWDWLFRDNLYPLTTAKPLEFGVAFHFGMETYYDPEKAEWPQAVRAALAIEAFVSKCEEQRQKVLDLQDINYLDESIEQDYNERVELGKGMLRNYFENIAPNWDYGWTVEDVEVSFMVPIPNPDTGEPIFCKCDLCWAKWEKHLAKTWDDPSSTPLENMKAVHPDYRLKWQGLPVTYAGRLDVLARDANGDLWVVDWKTAANIPDDHYWLELDDQVGSYPWALNRLGIPVRGFVYVEIRKAFPEPPKENASRRKGCKFSVSRQQATTFEVYFAHVFQHDTEAVVEGCYEDFFEWLKNNPTKFTERHLIYHTMTRMKAIEKNIGLEALDMIDPRLRIYPSPGRFGCGGCAFRQPCLEKDNDGDYQYLLDTMYEERVPYYVREAPSTESKGGE
jgi:hypothetical protein